MAHHLIVSQRRDAKPSWWQHLEPNIEDGRKKENRTTNQQLTVLNETFKKRERLTDSETKKLSRELKMSQRRIKVRVQLMAFVLLTDNRLGFKIRDRR